MAGQQDAHAYTRQIYKRVTEEYGEATDLGLYLATVVSELFEMSPGAREHISDFLIADLCEELAERGDEEAMEAVLKVQRDWSQEV